MSAPFLVFEILSEWSFFFLPISSAQILHIRVHNVTLYIMICWSKRDVEVSWYSKMSSTLQCIEHSQSTFQLEGFKNSFIDPLRLTMEKINGFLWPFCAFSMAGCSAWLRNRDNRTSDWICLTPPPFPKQYSLAGHTRLIIKVTFAVRLHGPWGYPAALFSRNEVSADAFGYIQSQWLRNNKKILKYMSGFIERESSNTHFHPRMGRIQSNQGNVKEIAFWKAENAFCEKNRCSTTNSPALKTGSF